MKPTANGIKDFVRDLFSWLYKQKTIPIHPLSSEMKMAKKLTFTFEAVKGERARHSPDVVYTIDFKVTPHILRHTYITNLRLRSVDIKTVQYLAGNERAKITLDIHAHLTYNRPKEIIEKINTAFVPGAVTGNWHVF